MRLQKFLSNAGVASRRRGENLIREGRVAVNGIPAKIGQSVNELEDQVTVNGKRINLVQDKTTYLINKPRFVVSTVSDPQGRDTVMSLIPQSSGLFPVGRLDYESEGLMLLTNDGDLAYQLTHPKFEVNKTYLVQVKGKLTQAKIDRLEKGLIIDGRRTAPATITVGESTPERTWFEITIHEGRNRQIRKMCAAVSLPVTRLIRLKFGNYELGNLRPGEYQLFKD